MSDKHTWSRRRKRFIKTALYECWWNAKQRCGNPTNKAFKYYGGRGIEVLITFNELLDEIGHRPDKHMVLGRIDKDGDYAKGNVAWQSMPVYHANRRHPVTPLTCSHKSDKTARHHAHGLCQPCYRRTPECKASKRRHRDKKRLQGP